MTMDLDERARRAGAELRATAAERARSLHPPAAAAGSHRPRVLALAAAAIVVVVAAVGLVLDGAPTPLEIDPVAPGADDPDGDPGADDPSAAQAPGPVADADGWLPVPELGEVTAAYRADGTPVFVTHPADGEVLILDAIDPHRASDLDKLVAFCPSSGWFEDLYHGSRFNAWGDWTGGPAPTGLPVYPTELDAAGSRVRITGDLQAAPARDDPRGGEQSPVGPSCVDELDVPADIVGHRPPAAVPVLDGDTIPADRWVWAELVLGGEPGAIRVCDPDGTCPPDAPEVTFTLGQPGTQVERTPVTYLARLAADGLVRILHPADPTDGGYTQIRARDQAALIVPPPGEARALVLGDDTPVFATQTATGEVHLLAAWAADDPAHLLDWCPSDQTLRGPRGRYAADGRNLDVDDGPDLARYDIEVEDIGETRGIRLLAAPDGQAEDGQAGDGEAAGPTPDADGMPPPACDTEPVAHRPAAPQDVIDEPDGVHLSPERWRWVRMPIEVRDGALYLCTLANAVPDCGVPHPEHTICRGEIIDEEQCRAVQDPTVSTPGIDPVDEPRLLLVRPSADGTTTRVRIPR